MKTKLLYILLVTILLTNVVLLFLLVKKPKRHEPPAPPHHFLFKELKFDDSQLGTAEAYTDLHHSKMKDIDEEIRHLKKTLFTSFSSDNTINTDSIADLIGNNEAKKDKEILRYFKKVRSVCNESQKKKFDKIVSKALHRGKKRGPKGPPR